MKEVIRVQKETKEEVKNPVEFTHVQMKGGWEECDDWPDSKDDVYYLGYCDCDGDVFMVMDGATMLIYKGHLNSGKY